MSPQLEELFHQVTDLDPQARCAYLDAHCTDPALRTQIEKLLEFDRGAEDFLAAPLQKIAAQIERETPPTQAERIGPYRIVRCLGRGGMGAVYEGERQDGELTLRVAIKFVPIALRTALIVERFRQERQILANLDHPNISRVLDAGTTSDGSPYLVMELIDGKPIDVWCRERRLTVRQIVELFIRVCSAVQHAHQNLVIHRDLKPGNILVTAQGEPKLLDFGIAKLMDEAHRNEETTVRALTPDYASPEQIAGRAMTTATDVYGLGCVLYALLAGEPPRRDPDGQRAPCASTRNPELAGDVDSILDHALDPDPECRYRTVQELAEDLRRFLAHEPVLAAPHGWFYIVQRFVRRKPLLAGLLLALAVSIVAGTTLSLWQARRAERRFQEVRSLANAFLFRFEEQIRDIPGTTSARQFVVNTALSYLQRLARDSSGDPELRLELAAAYRKVSEVQFSSTASSLGDTAGAGQSLERASSLLKGLDVPAAREESARVLLRTGDLNQDLGRLPEALQCGRDAQALADNWLKTEPRNPVAMDLGSQSAVLIGRVLRRTNQMDEARVSIERAVSIDRLALETDPSGEEDNLRIASDLGWLAAIEQGLGHLPEAIQYQSEAVAILERLKEAHRSSAAVDRGRMVGMSRLASLLETAGHEPNSETLAQALDYLQQAAAIARTRVAMDRQDTRARMDLQSVLTRQGSAWLDAGYPAEAAQALNEAVGIARGLEESDPANREAKLNLGIALATQAEVLSGARAAAQRQEARRLYLDLLAGNPGDAKVLYPYGYNQSALVKLDGHRDQLCREGLAKLGGPTADSDIRSAYGNLVQACAP